VGEPWAWSVATSTAGVTVTVRDTQATNRLRAAIDLFLPADRAYLVSRRNWRTPRQPTSLQILDERDAGSRDGQHRER